MPDERFDTFSRQVRVKNSSFAFYKIVANIKSTKLVHNLVYIRTGVTGTISYFRMTSSMGWGRRTRAVVCGSRTLVDGFIKKELIAS